MHAFTHSYIHTCLSFMYMYSFLCFVVFYLSLSFLTLIHFYHVLLACSIYSFRYVYHIFISYNLIFISYNLMTYTYTFLYLYVYLLSIPFMCSSFMPYHFILFFYIPLPYQIYLCCYFLFISISLPIMYSN